jgi:DNA-binding transcriptional LysR family regulator
LAIKQIDLNLFRIFEAIMRHRSVAGASRELTITPSAVSHALARLRRQLDDQLFIAVESGMVPTPRALELAPTIKEGLHSFLDAVRSKTFAPLETSRTFRIGMSDYATIILLPYIMDRIKASGPNVNLRIFPLNRVDVVEYLDNSELEMAVGCFADIPKRIRRMPVAVESETLVVRAGHPLTSEPLTMQRLLTFPHVVAELNGSEERMLDGSIDKQGMDRRIWLKRLLSEKLREQTAAAGRVAITVPHYSAAASLVSSSDMVTTLPRSVALREARREPLAVLELPYDPVQMTIEAVWHQKADRDAGLQWFVAEIVQAGEIQN